MNTRNFTELCQFNNLSQNVKQRKRIKNKLLTQHTLKFKTLYYPGSVKNIRLMLRVGLGANNVLDNHYKEKILVKQSYVILIWLNYLTQRFLLVNCRTPGFFIYPTKNYKTTIMKAPMAHKTFSQEQYMLRYYTLSISFYVPLDSDLLTNSNLNICLLSNVNASLYYLLFLVRSIPCISTNMLFLKRYTITIYSSDEKYFSFSEFNL
jgi:hypothetical protein